jgi:AcrR family transcriptional regulator
MPDARQRPSDEIEQPSEPSQSARNGRGPEHPAGHTQRAHGEHPLGREQVADIQRARMLSAMVEQVSERGAANVAVAHVVARSGVSRRTFYEIFADREACFLAAFDDGIARARRYVLDGYDPQARWDARIRTALSGLLAFLDVERDMGQLLIVGSLGAGARALERRRRVLAQMIALVDEGRTLTGAPRGRGQAGKQSKTGAQPPPLTAEGIVGGVLSVLHARLLEPDSGTRAAARPRMRDLTGPLMSMIVLPYLGSAAARRELERPLPKRPASTPPAHRDPLRDLEMRLTYRTVRVLIAVAEQPGSSNRAVGARADTHDQGQISKLLARLHSLGLIDNTAASSARGEPNAWTLTARGWEIHGVIAQQTSSA